MSRSLFLRAGAFAAAFAAAAATVPPAARAETVGDSLSAAGDALAADARDLGDRVGALFRAEDYGPMGEKGVEPTPADPEFIRNGAPFNTERDPEIRSAAGVALRRIGPGAALAAIEGARRPEGSPDGLELRLRLTNYDLWDAALERDRQDNWRLTRLRQIAQAPAPALRPAAPASGLRP